MLECPKQTFARLFYNVSTSFFLIFIFFHFTSIFLAKLFIFFGANPFYERNQDGYEFEDEEEMQKEDECCYGVESNLVEDSVNRGSDDDEDDIRSSSYDDGDGDGDQESSDIISEESSYRTPPTESSGEEEELEILAADSDSETHDPTYRFVTNTAVLRPSNLVIHQGVRNEEQREMGLKHEENFLVLQPEKDDIFGDAFTIGSTSKDSSEWRSSINTDDPFSSSSRRSCPKWESYTVFQKYDEEMLFLDRITAQKLNETESLRSIQACPRSISERIVLKLRTSSSKKSSEFRHNPYHELEAAYVAQICLTWEALNWNYNYFQRLRASRKHFDPGCPAYIAQQFQQFQVLLQRYVENEPYEHGKRPEIYARMRSLAPKLLQVPEYRDSNDDKREDEGGHSSRIPSSSFLHIMEESIRTFMKFMKRDKKNHYQMLADLFKRNRRGSADATLLLLLKKVNKKNKAKLKELSGSGNCLRKRKMKEEEELEMLMAQTDLKVVSRVLRMSDLNGEQLHWCENKMSKVRVSDGKLHRDSSPLFFPAH
ncbi:hypothetical protein ACS0TY_024310 [Phlomoides rotata]